MIVVSSSNGIVGIQEAMRILKEGGSALDAVEAGIRLVESNPEDHSVGYAGYPNILGEVELDASIMDGSTRTAGAVGSVRGFEHPISIARKVMDTIPHVLLVGPGAERFAAETGFEQVNLLTPEIKEVYEKGLLRDMPEDVFSALHDPATPLAKWVQLATDPERAGGTVNFIAMDSRGDIATGVSTSGWAWKYPGRLGDSPVIGAGSYADNRYGAAACTGMGEMAIRAGTARSVVLYLKMGLSLDAAGAEAMRDLDDLGGKYLSDMNIIALDRQGNPAAFSNNQDATFIYLTDQMESPIKQARQFISTRKRWGREE